MGNQQPSISGNGDEGSTTIETSYSPRYTQDNEHGFVGRAMEGVNRIPRQRGYEARDREEIMKKAKYLHEEGYRHVKIAMMLGISKGTLMRWNKEQGVFQTRAPGEAGKLAVKNIVITRTVFLISKPRIRLILRLNRKYEIFSSLMI